MIGLNERSGRRASALMKAPTTGNRSNGVRFLQSGKFLSGNNVSKTKPGDHDEHTIAGTKCFDRDRRSIERSSLQRSHTQQGYCLYQGRTPKVRPRRDVAPTRAVTWALDMAERVFAFEHDCNVDLASLIDRSPRDRRKYIASTGITTAGRDGTRP
jgi:hypothetical protein